MKNPINTAGARTTSLRPAPKPIAINMSSRFKKSGKSTDIVKLAWLLKHIFLRLGFDGYRGEHSPAGFRIRICDSHISSGRYCDNHSLCPAIVMPDSEFVARVADRGDHYAMDLSLATEQGGEGQ